jgi:hypothetical protein
MSKQLLHNLTRGFRGGLRRYLDEFEGEPHIAWYPSARRDYRPLLYLSEEYAVLSPPSGPEPVPPDIFLFTDYFPWYNPGFRQGQILYRDGRTEIRVISLEELPRLDLPLHDKIVVFPEVRNQTGRSFFMRVHVKSHRLKERICQLIYTFVENDEYSGQSRPLISGKPS